MTDPVNPDEPDQSAPEITVEPVALDKGAPRIIRPVVPAPERTPISEPPAARPARPASIGPVYTAPPGPGAWLLRLGLLGVLGAGATVLGIAIAPKTPSGAAVVDGVSIPVSRIDARVEAGYTPTVAKTQTKADYARSILAGEVSRVLLEQLGKDLKITPDAKAVADGIDAEEKAGGGAETFYKTALKAGYTKEQVAQGVRDDLLLNDIAEALVKQRPPKESDVQSFYAANPDQFVAVHLTHILTNNKASSDHVTELAKAHPDQFGNLARTYSTDKDTASKGGDLGAFSEAQYKAALGSQAVVPPVVGTIIGPVELGTSFDLIKVLNVTNATLEQSRATIESVLSQATSPYARGLVKVALSVTGHKYGVSIKGSYGHWSFDTQEIT